MLAVLLFVPLAAVPAAAPQTQTLPSPIIDYAAPPLTLAEMFQRTSAVVRAVVTDAGALTVYDNGRRGGIWVVRYPTLRIVEVFKQDGDHPLTVGATAKLREFGGALTSGSSGYTTESAFPPLQSGEDLIAFLGRAAGADVYTVGWGANGLLRIHDGRVAIPKVLAQRTAEFSPNLSNDLESVLMRLRSHRGRLGGYH